jgi:hypothetical protein
MLQQSEDNLRKRGRGRYLDGVRGVRRQTAVVGFLLFADVSMNSAVFWDVVPSWLILLTLMMKAICISETSVLTKTTLRLIPEDGILHIAKSHKLPIVSINK